MSYELVANGYNYTMTTVSPKQHYSSTSKQPMRHDCKDLQIIGGKPKNLHDNFEVANLTAAPESTNIFPAILPFQD